MLDYADPCKAGPLSCGVGCRADSDVESVSLLSTAYSRNSRISLASSFHGVPTNPIEELKNRVSTFQSKGWLSQQEHRKYMALLQTAPTPKENSQTVMEHVLQELEKELDMLEEKMSGGTMLNKQTRLAVLTPRGLTPTHDRPRAIGVFPEPKRAPFDTVNNKMNKGGSSIVDPKDLANDLSEDRISELFVETCFFGRLGFVQPPCCLQCNYRESLKGAVPNTNCGRWVIWRRDAKHVLHPHHLCDNAIAIQCHAARKLLVGKMVDNHKWDTTSKVLLQPRTMKPFQPKLCM
jgi:hypothetical protein